MLDKIGGQARLEQRSVGVYSLHRTQIADLSCQFRGVSLRSRPGGVIGLAVRYQSDDGGEGAADRHGDQWDGYCHMPGANRCK